MPPDDKNLSNQAAEDTVFSNLGLTREDLGIGDDDGSGNEDLGLDSGSGDRGDGSGNEASESRTSHTTTERSGLPPTAEVHPDHKGNLVNEYGQIVARSGKEARLYQDLHKTKGQAQTLQGQITGRHGTSAEGCGDRSGFASGTRVRSALKWVR